MSMPTYTGLARIWFIYCGIGGLLGLILYFIGGERVIPLALATFAILAVIGTIIVSTALWAMLRERARTQRSSSGRPE